MAACIHGDVCRAWMKQTGSIAPLRVSCPNCPWYEPYRPCDYSRPYDTYWSKNCLRDWQGTPVVTCRTMIQEGVL